MEDQLVDVLVVILVMIIILVIVTGVFLAVQITHNNSEESEIPVETTSSYYVVTEEERELLARIVTCEASICSVECQQDVCSVIFNRLESQKWTLDLNGDNKITVYDIVYYPNAFSPLLDGSFERCVVPTKEAYEAVDYVIHNGPTLPTYVRYFRADTDFNWDNYMNYKEIDNVYFGYFKTWKEGTW